MGEKKLRKTLIFGIGNQQDLTKQWVQPVVPFSCFVLEMCCSHSFPSLLLNSF